MPNESIEHIHQLKRKNYANGTPVFFCTGDDCTFKIGIEFALGKRTICWRCGKPFKLTSYSLRLAKPHCESCHKSKSESTQVTTFEIKHEALVAEQTLDSVDELKQKMNALMTDEVEL